MAAIAGEITLLHLRMLGGESIQLPAPWHAAIGYLRTEMVKQELRTVVMDALGALMGARRV